VALPHAMLAHTGHSPLSSRRYLQRDAPITTPERLVLARCVAMSMTSCSTWLPGSMVIRNSASARHLFRCAAPPHPYPATMLSSSPRTSLAVTT
jgi:hypothetical protein